MSAAYNVQGNDRVTISNPKDEGIKRRSGVFFRGSHLIAALFLVVLLVIGVGIITYFATITLNVVCVPKSKSPTSSQRWDNCIKEAKGKKLCMMNCSTSTMSTTRVTTPGTTKPATRPTTMVTKPTTQTTELTTETFTSTTAPTPTDLRLPTNLYPVHYRVTLHPRFYDIDEKTFRFNGEVVIRLHCYRATNIIVLHTRDLTYDNSSIQLVEIDGSHIKIEKFTFDSAGEFVKFQAEQNLTPGKEYNFTVKFSGPLKKDLEGLYLSSYNRDNRTVYLVTTHLEPIGARKIFPCFDEPAIKSVFQVRLVRTSNMTSLSNMEIIETRFLHDDFWIDTFNDSLKMSIYLFAVSINDFVNSTTYTNNGIKISVWTRPEFVNQSVYALNIAKELIQYYEQLFKVPYPLSKIDMLAVPDMNPWAMENWGLITYREDSLLYHKKLLLARMKIFTAMAVAHELAHQWFGNLVTMSWWDDVWLNEGFATFIVFIGLGHVEPTWNYIDNFRLGSEIALDLDGFKSSHPLHVPVSNTDEINEIFDDIAYKKGGQIIKMMQFFLGKDNFEKGLNIYLNENAYANTNNSDLWRAMGKSSGMDVKGIMTTWVDQMNFPLVHIRRLSSGVGGNVTLEISQERYLTSKNESESEKYTSPFGYRWRIPMTIGTNTSLNTNKTIIWLNETQDKVSIDLPYTLQNDEWVIGNLDSNVFCRVNYDQSNWNLLIQQLKTNHTVISTTDRVMLIYDACKLARASYINTTTCLDVLSYIDSEFDYPVLVAAFDNLQYINDMLAQRPIYGTFLTWVRSKAAVLFNKTTFLRDPNIMTLSKVSFIVNVACKYGHEMCVEELNSLFQTFIQTIPSDRALPFAKEIYCYGVMHGKPDVWNKLYDSLEKVTVMERDIFITALGCTKEVWLLNTYLINALKEMRTQSIPKVIAAVCRTVTGRTVAFNFFREHFDEFVERLGGGLADVIKSITSSMNTPSDLEQLKAFLSAHPDQSSGANAFQSALSTVEANIEWVKVNEQQLTDWFANR